MSMLNNMCKLLEKIINSRLIWYIESVNYLSHDQNGFRKNKGVHNTLFKIKSEIEKAKREKQIIGMVCLDLAKAYDSTWRPRIVSKLRTILCEGKMLNFIISFLKDRSFKLRSTPHYLENLFNKMVFLKGLFHPSLYF